MATRRRYYMACLDLTGRSVLVVGGGPVALEKVEGLLAAGAASPSSLPRSCPSSPSSTSRFVRRGYRTDDLDGQVPRRRRHLDDVGQPPRLPRRRGAVAPLQRRRRARAVLVHPPRHPPPRADRDRRLDGRRLARARPAPPRPDRDRRAARARRARPAAARAAPLGEVALRHLRGAQGVLRRARRRRSSDDRPPRRRRARRPGADHRPRARARPLVRRARRRRARRPGARRRGARRRARRSRAPA